MKIDFFTTERLTELWGYVKMLMEGIAPGIMIVSAISAVGFLIGIVVKAYRQSSKEDDDDDIEFRHY